MYCVIFLNFHYLCYVITLSRVKYDYHISTCRFFKRRKAHSEIKKMFSLLVPINASCLFLICASKHRFWYCILMFTIFQNLLTSAFMHVYGSISLAMVMCHTGLNVFYQDLYMILAKVNIVILKTVSVFRHFRIIKFSLKQFNVGVVELDVSCAE